MKDKVKKVFRQLVQTALSEASTEEDIRKGVRELGVWMGYLQRDEIEELAKWFEKAVPAAAYRLVEKLSTDPHLKGVIERYKEMPWKGGERINL